MPSRCDRFCENHYIGPPKLIGGDVDDEILFGVAGAHPVMPSKNAFCIKEAAIGSAVTTFDSGKAASRFLNPKVFQRCLKQLGRIETRSCYVYTVLSERVLQQ